MAYMTKERYRRDKTRLSRAIGRLNRAEGVQDRRREAQRVIGLVDETLRAWDAEDLAWPDDWSRWQRASDDAALIEMRLERW